jgi:hypothetical protein
MANSLDFLQLLTSVGLISQTQAKRLESLSLLVQQCLCSKQYRRFILLSLDWAETTSRVAEVNCVLPD